MGPQLSFDFHAPLVRVELSAPSREKLNELIDNYFGSYLPEGYDTRITQEGRNPEGGFYARIERYNSCD